MSHEQGYVLLRQVTEHLHGLGLDSKIVFEVILEDPELMEVIYWMQRMLK